ncbi:MAG TPA: hypothetical protein VLA52_17670, partial [Thermohalobaculum sp.]|nr:hypothetical protein [Thermohalobaculum sp.]
MSDDLGDGGLAAARQPDQEDRRPPADAALAAPADCLRIEHLLYSVGAPPGCLDRKGSRFSGHSVGPQVKLASRVVFTAVLAGLGERAGEIGA